jgi:Fe-S-cluster containining protein
MIKQLVPQEACRKCQGCCRFAQEDSLWAPGLLEEEIALLLKEGLPAALITGQKKIRVVAFPQQELFICSLFDPQKNACKIYAQRPLECQLYPFLLQRKAKQIFLAIDPKCPYAAQNLDSPTLKEYTQYLLELLRQPQYRELLKQNPQVIQEYPDVQELQEI